jgi:L-ascorbate metabolism protein UlaG (beta-lactamase superfamily)
MLLARRVSRRHPWRVMPRLARGASIVLLTMPRGRITWLGHATVLIELGPLRLLTDPVLRSRIAHLRRHVPAPEPPERLDAVLLSHLHRDHADGPSLRQLPPDVPVIAPAGTARVVRGLGAAQVIELRAGETLPLDGGTVTAVPAEHDGRRSPLHPAADALGFVVENGPRVYFAGDTDLFDGMAELRPLDVALVPIWGWGPSLGPGHLDPRAAARAVALLQPRVALPIHWATYLPLPYRRGHPLLREPGPAFAAHVAELAPGTRVALLRPGEALDL